MNRILLLAILTLIISTSAIGFVLVEFIAPYINMLVLITFVCVALILGFLLGIKLMSDIE